MKRRAERNEKKIGQDSCKRQGIVGNICDWVLYVG